jgi:trimethylamine--corrinoid protein Co-methyltransferase
MASGMTDAKVMDAQAGYEKAITSTALALTGTNLVAAYPGIVGSLLGQSFEGLVIDNDMFGNVQRLLRGIEITEETLSYDVIRDTVYGSGHYLGHPQTLALMQTEYLYPEVADRRTAGEWESSGKEDVVELAHRKVPLPRLHRRGGRPAHPRPVPDPPGAGGHAARQRPLVKRHDERLITRG